MHALQEARLSCNPTAPMPRGHRINVNSPGMAFLFKFTTAPTSSSLSDIREHTEVVGGLSRLDADCNLSKLIRKQGRYLHAIQEVRRLR